MDIHVSQVPTSAPGWHALYHDALFEKDKQKLPFKIANAEKAILTRMKELFNTSGDHIEEDLILDDALYALRALRTCVQHEMLAA
jgi:hypothetical protein